MKNPVNLLSPVSILMFSVATLTAQWTDPFAGSSLNPAWSEETAVGATYSATAVNYDYEVTGGQLVVNDVVPTGSGNHTADFILRRSVDSLADFQATFDFGWNMTSSVDNTLVENRKAVPRILLRFMDGAGNIAIEVGFEDQGYSGGGSTGNVVAGFGVSHVAGQGPYSYTAANSAIIGGAVFNVVRDGGNVFIFRDGGETAVATGFSLASIEYVELVFGRRNFNSINDEFFGQAWVNEVSVIPEPAAIAYLAVIGGLVFWGRRRWSADRR